MERLAQDGQLMAYRHTGFWQPMDTVRDRQYLENLWNTGNAPWRHGSLDHDSQRVLSATAGAGDGTDRGQRPVARKLAWTARRRRLRHRLGSRRGHAAR